MLLLFCATIAVIRGQVVVNDTASGESAQKSPLRWEPMVQIEDNVFPSAIIATTHLHLLFLPQSATRSSVQPVLIGDPGGWLAVRVVSPHAGARVTVRIRSQALFADSFGEFVLPQAGKIYEIHPDLAWNIAALRGNRDARTESISFAMSLEGFAPETKLKRVLVRSINDCPTGLVDNGHFVDYPWFFPAYVNEDHPWVGQILDEAKQSGLIRQFSGYESHDPENVHLQVYAIWNVLQRRGLTYSSLDTVAPRSNRVRSQEVRFLEQSIATTRANCVDGSVLFASILQKIGLEPFLIQIPGHMLVGYYLDPLHQHYSALETTMMGRTDLRQFAEDRTAMGGLGKLLGAETKNSASWKTFVAALRQGNKEYAENQRHIQKHEPDYALVDITQVRKFGIMPIAYSGETR
jgi:hypothetical protein